MGECCNTTHEVRIGASGASLPYLPCYGRCMLTPISAGEMFIVPKVVEHKTQLIGLFGGAVTSLLASLRVLINLYSSQNDPECRDQFCGSSRVRAASGTSTSSAGAEL